MISKEYGPITRHMLALYAGGSGDHNPLHIDIDFARNQAGMPDVIGHGMLTMAFLGRLLNEEFEDHAILAFETRFETPSRPGDSVICEATEKGNGPSDTRLVELVARRADGRILASGHAILKSKT